MGKTPAVRPQRFRSLRSSRSRLTPLPPWQRFKKLAIGWPAAFAPSRRPRARLSGSCSGAVCQTWRSCQPTLGISKGSLMVANLSTSAIDLSWLKHSGRSPARRGAMCGFSALAAVTIVLCARGFAAAQDPAGNSPADAMLRLVPPDSAVVLSVEDFRQQFRAFTSSPLFAGLKQLPAVKAWIQSEKGQQLLRSRDQIEAVLGTKLSDICDELIGDAVVLALELRPEEPADSSQARGLLLVQARDRALLERLIQVVNDKQKASGELAQVTEREHRGTRLPHARVSCGGVTSVGMVHRLSGWNVRFLEF